MRNTMRKWMFVVLFFLFSAVAARADSVNLTFVSVVPGYNNGNVAVYPYEFSIDGSATLSPLMCDDFSDDIDTGESWNANVFDITNVALPGNGQMDPGGSDRQYKYDVAAYLFHEAMLPSNNDPTDESALNTAVWLLFDSSTSPVDALAMSDLNDAENAITGILNDPGKGQSYLNGQFADIRFF